MTRVTGLDSVLDVTQETCFPVCTFVQRKEQERTRVIENNLLLSSPGFSLLPALGSSVCCIRGKHCGCGAYALCHLTEIRSDDVFCLCANSYSSVC